jgi:hypothetical protein
LGKILTSSPVGKCCVLHPYLLSHHVCSSCEFLNKLDLTINFIDLDALEESVDNLTSLLHLRELYLMGNPCMEEDAWPEDEEWKTTSSASKGPGGSASSTASGGAQVGMGAKARAYIVARLPQLQMLDGREIMRAERITANQRLPKLKAELRVVADRVREKKGLEALLRKKAQADDETDDEDDDGRPGDDEEEEDDDPDKTEPWCPETRVKMYREQAKRKAEEEKRKKAMEPPKRDYEKEHREAVQKALEREALGGENVKQCNEGRWEFVLEDEDGSGNVCVRIKLSKYLDSSLIHAEVHPRYVTVIIKGKTFRLSLPEEVRADAGICQRSKTTGELVITAPKIKQNEVLRSIRKREKMEKEAAAAGKKGSVSGATEEVGMLHSNKAGSVKPSDAGRVKRLDNGSNGSASGSGSGKLFDEMMAAASLAGPVKVEGIVKQKNNSGPGAVSASAASTGGEASNNKESLPDGHGGTMLFRAAETKRNAAAENPSGADGSKTVKPIPQGILGAKGAALVTKQRGGGLLTRDQAEGGDEDDLPPLI